MDDRKSTMLNMVIAFCVFAGTFAALRLTVNDPGMAWDEGNDIRMARGAVEWFDRLGERGARPFSRAEVERYWGYEWKQHPAVSRIYYAAVYILTGGDRHATAEWREWKAYRAGPMILFAALAAGVFLFGAKRLGGRWAGLTAAAALVFMPRMFGHAHIVETDLAVCGFWFAAAWAFLRGLESRKWAAAFGVALGLMPAVKFSGLFCVVPFFAYGFIFNRKNTRANLLAAALISPVVFYAAQPMYWHTPVASLLEYLRHFMNPAAQGTISTMYFGARYAKSPPWSYPFVITGLVVPAVTLVFAGAGVCSAFMRRAEPKKFLVFVIFNALFLPALFSPPRVPVYDGERLFLAAFPFMALLAGAGFVSLFGKLNAPLKGILLAVFAAVPIVATWQSRPFNMCYYNEIAGGAAGAERRGMDVINWGETFTPEFARRLNERLPRGARLTTIGYYSGNFDYFKSMGLLRSDIEVVDYGVEADFVVVFNRPGVLDPYSEYLFKRAPPLMSVNWMGTRLTGVYLLRPGLRFFK